MGAPVKDGPSRRRGRRQRTPGDPVRAGHVRCSEGGRARHTRPAPARADTTRRATPWNRSGRRRCGSSGTARARATSPATPPSSAAWRRSTSPIATSTCRSRRSARRRPKRSATGSPRCAPEQRPEIVLSSPYVRARQTADRVLDALHRDDAARDDETIACVRDERLREKEFGILDRLTPLGIRAKYPDLAEQRLHVGKFYFRPPGGESWCDVILRLRSFLDMLTREYRGDRVLVVAHQVIVNCLRYLLERLDEERILAIDRLGDVPNCGITSYALRSARRPARQARPAARELRLAAARSRRAGDRRARPAGRAEVVMAEIGATVEIDAQLLRAWPLPRPDGAADKEERGATLVIAGSAEMPGAAALAATSALRAGAGKIAVATVAAIAPGIALAARRSTRHRDGRDRGRRHRRRRDGQDRGAARQGRCRADRPRPAGRGGDARLHAPRPQARDARRRRRRCAGDGRRPRRPTLRAHAAADAARRRDGAPHRRDQGSGERRPGTARARGGVCAGTPSSPSRARRRTSPRPTATAGAMSAARPASARRGRATSSPASSSAWRHAAPRSRRRRSGASRCTRAPGARSPSGSARSAISPASCRRRFRSCWTSSPTEAEVDDEERTGTLLRQARFQGHERAAGRQGVEGRVDLRDPEARREPPALRLSPRARRHAEELGGAQGAEPRPGRQAHGGARRGPSDRLRPLRGNDSERPVRRRRGHRLGQRHLGAGRRSARRLPRRQAQVPPRRQEAARRLDAGAHARPRRRAPGAVAADQGEGRGGAAERRVQRRRRRAEERALGPDDRRSPDGGREGSGARRFAEGRRSRRSRPRRRPQPGSRHARRRPALRRPRRSRCRPARSRRSCPRASARSSRRWCRSRRATAAGSTRSSSTAIASSPASTATTFAC